MWVKCCLFKSVNNFFIILVMCRPIGPCENFTILWRVDVNVMWGQGCLFISVYNLIQVVKKQKDNCEKRSEIQSGGQEMAVMVG